MRDNLTALVDQILLPVPLDWAAVVLQPFEQGIGSSASDFNVIAQHKVILARISSWSTRVVKCSEIGCDTGWDSTTARSHELIGIKIELMAWEDEDLEKGVSSVAGTKPVKVLEVFITFSSTSCTTHSSSSVDNKNGFSASSILSDGLT